MLTAHPLQFLMVLCKSHDRSQPEEEAHSCVYANAYQYHDLIDFQNVQISLVTNASFKLHLYLKNLLILDGVFIEQLVLSHIIQIFTHLALPRAVIRKPWPAGQIWPAKVSFGQRSG